MKPPTVTELDAMPYGQIVADLVHPIGEWQRIDPFNPQRPDRTSVWLSLDGYGTRNALHLLASFGISQVLDVRPVVETVPPIEREPEVEVSQA